MFKIFNAFATSYTEKYNVLAKKKRYQRIFKVEYKADIHTKRNKGFELRSVPIRKQMVDEREWSKK